MKVRAYVSWADLPLYLFYAFTAGFGAIAVTSVYLLATAGFSENMQAPPYLFAMFAVTMALFVAFVGTILASVAVVRRRDKNGAAP